MLENLEMTIFDMLAEPFPPEIVHWRVGSTNKQRCDRDKGLQKNGQPLAYLDARDVMDRLDFVCGPDGWQCRYVNTGNGTTCCELGLKINDEWIWKSDGAGQTQFEGDKGQYSDALKRAAVRWGIGRYLYGCKVGWIDLDDNWNIPKNALQGLNKSLERAGQVSIWGDRNIANMARLIIGSIKNYCNTTDDVRRFIADHEGQFSQLKVGPKREIQKHLQAVIDSNEAKVTA